jgi:hypothetical protein
MNKRDWIDAYNEKNCTCKNASRNNSCKGLITCTLRADHPERKAMHVEDLKALWAGRKRNGYYPFNYVVAVLGKRTTRVFGPPNYYRQIDWRGLI